MPERKMLKVGSMWRLEFLNKTRNPCSSPLSDNRGPDGTGLSQTRRRCSPTLDCLDHLIEAGTAKGGACDPIVHKKQGVGVTFLLCHLFQKRLLVRDLSRVNLHRKTTSPADHSSQLSLLYLKHCFIQLELSDKTLSVF